MVLVGREHRYGYLVQSRDKSLFPHDPFKALVVPRPIGWIATVSAKGELNLAPYSRRLVLGRVVGIHVDEYSVVERVFSMPRPA